MAYFKDADEVYATLGKLFVEIATDEELAPKFRKANTIVRYEYSEPGVGDHRAAAGGRAGRRRLRRVGDGARGDDDDGGRHRAPLLARRRSTSPSRSPAGEIKAKGPVAKILKLVPLAKPRLPALQGAARGAGPRGPRECLSAGGRVKAEEWAGVVRGLAAKRGVRYEPVGGLNPRGRPGGALPRRHQPDHRRARERVLGRLVRRRRARGGRPVLEDRAAAGGARQGPHARPGRRSCRCSTSSRSRPRERIEQLASRRKVEFESIDFNRRFLATVPERPRPDRPARAVQPGLPRLGGADRQRGRLRGHRPPALLPLAAARAQRATSTSARSTTPASCSSGCARDGGARAAHLPARPLARRPGAVPGR